MIAVSTMFSKSDGFKLRRLRSYRNKVVYLFGFIIENRRVKSKNVLKNVTVMFQLYSEWLSPKIREPPENSKIDFNAY